MLLRKPAGPICRRQRSWLRRELKPCARRNIRSPNWRLSRVSFIADLRRSSDRFVVAEGARGMVMSVFTLPSYDVVFKLIKDRFDLPKDSTREDVRRRYRLVFEHDRAGRLVEAHEFEHLRIPADRFDSELLAELLRDAASIVKMEGGDAIIAHAYVERRLRPLNLFFAEADATQSAKAARDYD